MNEDPFLRQAGEVQEEIYQRLTKGGSGHLPLPDRALFTLTGPDRVRYLNGQITNDVASLKLGEVLYGAVLTGKGKIIGDLFVAASGDTLWIDAPLSLRSSLFQRLTKFLIADDAELTDVTDSYTLTHLFNGQTHSSLQAFSHARFGLRGVDVWSRREESVELSDYPTVPSEIAETFRIESGWGQWGSELDENTLPQEVNFERRGLSYDKGCYVGQETIARIRSIGHVNRHLASLELVEGTAPTLPSSLLVDQTEGGKITSMAYSPLVQKTICLGMISRKYYQLGQILTSSTGAWKLIPPPRSS